MKKNYLLAAICCVIFITNGIAQSTHNWDTDASSGSWKLAENWSEDTTPGGGEILNIDNNSQTTMTNDLTVTNRYRIFFGASATTNRTVGGSAENTFYDFGGANPKIENNSSVTHTLNFPIKAGHTTLEINPVDGNLTFGGTVDVQGNDLYVYGSNAKELTFNGVISGASGDVFIQQDSKVIFNAINTYTGNTQVNRGDLMLAADMASGVEVNNDGNLEIIGSGTNVTIPYLTLNSSATTIIRAGNSLTVTGNFTNNSSNPVIIEHGASLIVNDTSTGNITYQLSIPDTNWHLISAPVVGEQFDDAWNTANNIASGTGSNRGVSWYNNTTDADGDWMYFQAGAGAQTFDNNKGYSLKRTAAGDYNFTGTFKDSDTNPTITASNLGDASENRWNLIGNPYPSYINIADFLTANATPLTSTHQNVYVWNGTAYVALATGYIHPGQAFFVNSNVASTTVAITEAMQSHQTGVTFYRSSSPTIHLSITDGASTKSTEINYLAGKTTELNPRYDVGTFTGQSTNFNVYTHLVSNSQGVDFMRQALPNSNYENMVIPVGVNAINGKEITFSANIANLPTGIKVFLEDKENNTFNRLDDNSTYKVTLTNTLNGIGRFYLHTSFSTLSVDTANFENVSMYKINDTTLRVTGLHKENANIKIYNILGKQVMSKSFKANGLVEVTLPQLNTGVYIIQLQTTAGKMNKKIIIE